MSPGGLGPAGLRVGERQRDPVQQRSDAEHQDGNERGQHQEPGAVVDQAPVRAGIDPYNKLVDRNSDDNRKRVDAVAAASGR